MSGKAIQNVAFAALLVLMLGVATGWVAGG
jgi:hypothetical protein